MLWALLYDLFIPQGANAQPSGTSNACHSCLVTILAHEMALPHEQYHRHVTMHHQVWE